MVYTGAELGGEVMRTRALVVMILSVVVAAPVFAQDTQSLVLNNGSTMEAAEVSLQQGLVYVTFANGRMQAYPAEEVDLVASGLVAASEGVTEAAESPPVGLAGAISAATEEARVMLTDADVAHVGPGVEEGEEGEGEDEAATGPRTAALLVSGLRQEISGAMMDLSGTVTNSGDQGVANITISADAVSSEGATSGRGTTNVAQELPPGGSVNFTMSFPVQGPVSDVRVRASAAVADFEFRPVTAEPAPAEEGGGE
jgi:hypothetical protein